MSTFAPNSDAIGQPHHSLDEALALARLEDRISPLLSVIAGMVDLTGFFTLGNIFTAHVTGNLVVVAALAVRGGKPSASPHGLNAGIAAMIAVSAMACQYALFRLAMPRAVSTSVMTGNLTNTVLSLMDASSPGHELMPVDAGRLKRSVYLLVGFLVGCVVAAAAISVLGDWAWSLPVALAALTIGLATLWTTTGNITQRRDQR